MSGVLSWVLTTLAIGIVSGPLSAQLGRYLSRRRAQRLQSSSRVACCLRTVEGRCRGLSRRWRRGTAVIADGHLDFEPIALWHRPVRLRVTSISRANQREYGDNPLFRIVDVVANDCALECALDNNALLWAVDQLKTK